MFKIFTTAVTFLFIVFCGSSVFAQAKIPLMRQTFHDKIDALQKTLLRLDGKADLEMNMSDDVELNLQLTYAATKRIDDIETYIEQDTAIDNNAKIKYLRGLSETLEGFFKSYRNQQIKLAQFPVLINTYNDAIKLDASDQSIETTFDNASYEIGDVLVKTIAFQDNAGITKAKEAVFLKNCQLHPDKILPLLRPNTDYPFTDSLISFSAHYNPELIYDYAQGSDKLASRIYNSKDTLVQIISRLAKTKSGRFYYPFLDNLYHGKITTQEIDIAKDDPARYYSLLVKTKIDYADRAMRRDTPMVMEGMDAKLKDAGKYYISSINGLHESPDNVRFRILENLTPQELYYLAVMQEEEIYTSSYVRGVYPRIFSKMKVARGDSLLINMRFDHFKKWIKMAANYNTLDDFLKKMDPANAQVLMKAFVNGLDKKVGKDSLEDAVDVAGSYASIYDPKIQKLVLQQVQENLQQAKQTNNNRATDIYGVLNTLFLSMDSSNHIDVSKELGIRPVYYMPNKSLRDTSGRIIIQQFFYGDKDGQGIFNSFVNLYTSLGWKKTVNENWVAFSSVKGVPVTIYSNRALDETQGLDDKAQDALVDYLAEHDLNPTVVIHRGHSYFLINTIKRLAPSAQVVLLGSCGGYQSLNQILSICPEAHIISSKQTGAGAINITLINGILSNLKDGKDLNWPIMWKTFTSQLGSKNDLFNDYVPPYKNLGAVFIMAYTKLQNSKKG